MSTINARNLPTVDEFMTLGHMPRAHAKASRAMFGSAKFNPEKLREVQRDVLNELAAAYDAGQRVAHVILPTGAGKSLIIALAPFVLRLGRALVCSRLQDINQANVRVYDSAAFKAAFGEELELGSRNLIMLSIARDKNEFKNAIIASVGTQTLLRPDNFHLVGRFALVQIDEVQSMCKNDYTKLLAAVQKNPNAMVISYSASTIMEYIPPAQCITIQRTPQQCGITIKRAAILVVNTECIDPARFECSTREQLEQAVTLEVNGDVVMGKAANIMRKVNADKCIIKLLIIQALRVSDDLTESATEDRRPGIVVKCPSISKAHDFKAITNALCLGRTVHCIDSSLPERANKEALTKYEEGKVDVLVIVHKLSVGWHCSRTSVLVPLACSEFTNMMQFVGRGGSYDTQFSRQYVVVSDLFMLATRFVSRYMKYYRMGLGHGVDEADGVDGNEADGVDEDEADGVDEDEADE